MAIDYGNEYDYLSGLLDEGGGTADWAKEQAGNLGIDLEGPRPDSPDIPAPDYGSGGGDSGGDSGGYAPPPSSGDSGSPAPAPDSGGSSGDQYDWWNDHESRGTSDSTAPVYSYDPNNVSSPTDLHPHNDAPSTEADWTPPASAAPTTGMVPPPTANPAGPGGVANGAIGGHTPGTVQPGGGYGIPLPNGMGGPAQTPIGGAIPGAGMNKPPGQPGVPPIGGPFVPPPVQPPAIKPPTPAVPVRDMNQINSYVETQLAKKLAEAKSSADRARALAETDAGQYKTTINNQLTQAANRLKAGAGQAQTGVQTGYDRMQQTERDDRTIQDLNYQRNLDPFSGRSDYALGMIARERERTDREQSSDLSTRVGNINQDLANGLSTAEQDAQARLSKVDQDLGQMRAGIDEKLRLAEEATGPERERLTREIQNDERQYDLALRGENRSDVLANQQINDSAFNQSLQQFQANRGVYESDRNFDFDVNRYNTDFQYRKEQDLIGNNYRDKQANINNANELARIYGTYIEPKSGAQELYNQVKGMPTVASQELAYKKSRDEITDQQYKQKFDEDVRRFGLNYALEKAYKDGQIGNMGVDNKLQRDRLTLDQGKLDLERKQAEEKAKSGGMTTYQKYQQGQTDLKRIETQNIEETKDPDTDQPIKRVKDPSKFRMDIINMGIRNGWGHEDVDYHLKLYGLPPL